MDYIRIGIDEQLGAVKMRIADVEKQHFVAYFSYLEIESLLMTPGFESNEAAKTELNAMKQQMEEATARLEPLKRLMADLEDARKKETENRKVRANATK